jgi:hypothetical protein
MAEKLVRRRTYDIPRAALIGVCQAALGRMRAQVEQQDLERGTIVATIGGAGLAPLSELALKIAPEDAGRAGLVVTWRARKLGGDRAILPAFLASVDSLARRT